MLRFALPALLLLAPAGLLCAETATVDVSATAKVTFTASAGKVDSQGSEGVVVWLMPLGDSAPPSPTASSQHLQLAQKNKQFVPRLLAVQVGSLVDFPNLDPFFHNVFSLFNGKRFDLGLYESGSSRSVRFNRAGVSYIFCNIHPEMSAVVVAVPTRYFAVSNVAGAVDIHDVPAGNYEMHVWALGTNQAALSDLTKRVTVSAHNNDLGTIHLTVSAVDAHKNKFGEDYDPSKPTPY